QARASPGEENIEVRLWPMGCAQDARERDYLPACLAQLECASTGASSDGERRGGPSSCRCRGRSTGRISGRGAASQGRYRTPGKAVCERVGVLMSWKELKREMGFARSILTRRPYNLLLQITNRCNMKCTFCDFPRNAVTPENELSLGDLRCLSDQLSGMGRFVVSIEAG